MLEIQISNFPATSHECLAMNYESFLSVHLSTSPKSVYSFLSVGQRDNPPLSLCSKATVYVERFRQQRRLPSNHSGVALGLLEVDSHAAGAHPSIPSC